MFKLSEDLIAGITKKYKEAEGKVDAIFSEYLSILMDNAPKDVPVKTLKAGAAKNIIYDLVQLLCNNPDDYYEYTKTNFEIFAYVLKVVTFVFILNSKEQEIPLGIAQGAIKIFLNELNEEALTYINGKTQTENE